MSKSDLDAMDDKEKRGTQRWVSRLGIDARIVFWGMDETKFFYLLYNLSCHISDRP